MFPWQNGSRFEVVTWKGLVEILPSLSDSKFSTIIVWEGMGKIRTSLKCCFCYGPVLFPIMKIFQKHSNCQILCEVSNGQVKVMLV